MEESGVRGDVGEDVGPGRGRRDVTSRIVAGRVESGRLWGWYIKPVGREGEMFLLSELQIPMAREIVTR